MKFSVLMSVYYKEKAEYLDACLKSIETQTLSPNEIVLVEDGQLNDELYQIIKNWKMRLNIKSIKLKQNSGLATALNLGLRDCSHNIVARMDTDDICVPERFEKQISYLENHPEIDILGSQIAEYDENMNNFLHFRNLPCSHVSILKFAKTRVPFNHMTVVFKKDQVLEVGGYAEHVIIMQDWTLWGKLLKNKRIAANLNEVLVKARTGNELFQRRRGLKYIEHETASIAFLYKIRFIGFFYFIFNIFIHSLIRLLPVRIIKFFYSKILRTKNKTINSSNCADKKNK